MRLIVISIVFASCAAVSWAQDTVAAPEITSPAPPRSSASAHDMSQICAPTSGERRRFYPERAQARNLNGDAVLDCSVTPSNTLASCQIVEETPPGFGFGESALGLACLWRLSETTTGLYEADGERRIRRPVRFRLSN